MIKLHAKPTAARPDQEHARLEHQPGQREVPDGREQRRDRVAPEDAVIARLLLAVLVAAGLPLLLALGLIFLLNVITNDWNSWAYAWLLITGGVGLGLTLGSIVGEWGHGVTQTGNWMMAVSAALFALFATIFGQNDIIKTLGPVVIILAGVLILARVFRR